MKKPVVLLALLISTTASSWAQQFNFSKENYMDSSRLAMAIPALAKQVLDIYTNDNRQTYLDNMFRVALVAGQYELSILYIDSLRQNLNLPGVGFQFETYAKTRLAHQTGNEPFPFLFKKNFTQGYRQLSSEAKAIVSNYAGTSLPDLKKALNDIIEQQKAKDILSLDDAIKLLKAFGSYDVYSQILSTLQQIIKEEDKKMYVVEKTMIKTKDGSAIQAFVVRKREVKEKLPAVFIFNIYADSVGDVTRAKFYAAENYACVVANTRGKGSSPQVIEPFEHDANDAYDVIDWISKQKWSNGKVGMVGGSYLGFAQWAAAKKMHSALKTIMPQVSVGIGIDYPVQGNVFMSYALRWLHYVTNNKGMDQADFTNYIYWGSVFKTWYKKGASFRSLDTLEGRPNAIFQRWLQHPSFDSYWQNMTSYKTDFSKINIPVLTTTGYFDADQLGAMYYYTQHHAYNPKANHYLVIGPYHHLGAQSYPSKEVSKYNVDSVATSFNFRKLSVEWFNYTLKGSSKPSFLKDKVNYQIMGANAWGHAPTLKGMSNDTLVFYLGQTRVNQHYKLEMKPRAGDYTKQEIDFKDRSDTLEYASNVIDDNIDGALLNGISFISQPIEKPMVINGSFSSSIQAAINKKDFDISIKMYELMPDGQYFYLSSAVQRASYAKDRSKRQLLQPGEKETIPIDNSFITSKQLSKGSRIVVIVGATKSSSWQINYGTGKDVSDETIADAGEPLQIKWFCDSQVKIPVLINK